MYGATTSEAVLSGLNLSIDGNTLAVGLSGFDFNGQSNASKVSIYDFSGNDWV